MFLKKIVHQIVGVARSVSLSNRNKSRVFKKIALKPFQVHLFVNFLMSTFEKKRN
jgi:hypothetical protein